DSTVAQHRFRFAFILIVRQGTLPSDAEIARLEAYRSQFESFYDQATSGRAVADTTLKRSLFVSTFPAVGVVEGRSAPATIAVEKPAVAPITINLRRQTGAAWAPDFVVIPAGATSVSFTIAGLQTGVDE